MNTKMNTCDLRKCKLAQRHCRLVDHDEKTDNEQDEISRFYAQCLDSMHYYLFHLYELGQRTPSTDDIAFAEMADDIDANAQTVSAFIDNALLWKSQRLRYARKQHPDCFQRVDGGRNKFVIPGQIWNGDIDNSDNDTLEIQTYFDRFVTALSDVAHPIKRIQKLKRYLYENAFDSDAIRGDVERYCDSRNSNLCAVANEAAIEKQIGYFVNQRRCMLFDSYL